MTSYELLVKLLPRGAYSDDPESLVRKDLLVAGNALDGVVSSLLELLEEMFPDSASALLARWERTYQIVTDESLSDAVRIQNLLARVNYAPGIRTEFMQDALEPLFGYRPTIFEHASVEVGDEYWAFIVELDPDEVSAFFDYDESMTVLEKIKPAHTQGRVGIIPLRTDEGLTDRDLLGS